MLPKERTGISQTQKTLVIVERLNRNQKGRVNKD